KKKILITWPLPEAAMARARESYDVIAHGDDPKITIDEMIETAKSVDALLITLNEKCRKEVIDRIPENIKCISTYSIGFDHIDLDACKARGIKVGNAPHGVTVATAEIAMLLLLGSARRAGEGEKMIRTRSWPGWEPLELVGEKLDNKTLGIYGFGSIGQALAKRAQGFDMDIDYFDTHRASSSDEASYQATFHDSLDSLLSVSQFFSLNAPSTPETRYFFNKATIKSLPQGAIVVNTARGDLVDNELVVAALEAGRLAYAGFDVFAGEPNINEGYYDLPNTFLFPHIGSAATQAREDMAHQANDLIDALFGGADMSYALA
nr:Chain A, D-GLYCERATE DEHYDROGENASE [Hyphomicrobium methylovorum]1GDH_B Chain B, D-GLYCERATE DEHYDROGENASE [Hyphomicrobium methylovorum]